MTSEFGDPQVGIHGEWEYSTQYYRFQPEARTYPEAFAMLPSCPHPIYGEHFAKTVALSADGGSIGGGNVTYRRPVANFATEELGMAEENSVSARRYFRFARPVDDVFKALSLIPDEPHPRITGAEFKSKLVYRLDGGYSLDSPFVGGRVDYIIRRQETWEKKLLDEAATQIREVIAQALTAERRHAFDQIRKIAAARQRDGRHVAACEIEYAVAEAEARTD